MPAPATLLALLLAAPPAGAGGDSSGWRETLTPHFAIKHQAVWLPPGLTMGAERIHSRLRMDLGTFAPWMARERINLYVYADQNSFLRGEFHPPPWSNGLAIYGRRAVALPDMKDPHKLLQVMAHETTHLIFEAYWHDAHRQPPGWINEGLAMNEEAESRDRPETTVWYQQMALADPRSFTRLSQFFRTEPKDLHDQQDQVGEWYVQAYAVTHFLLRKHSPLSFKSFCAHLRDGKTAEEALWLAYHYRHVEDFEAKWRAWLADPSHRRRVSLLSKRAAEGDDGRSSASFHAFHVGDFDPRRQKGQIYGR